MHGVSKHGEYADTAWATITNSSTYADTHTRTPLCTVCMGTASVGCVLALALAAIWRADGEKIRAYGVLASAAPS